MNQTTPTDPNYFISFDAEIMESLRRHTVETSAAYLLPYLKSGRRVLDFGCGPGVLSVGLARAVAPGELHGVDRRKSQVDLARAMAAALRQENAIFHVADVTDLPFEDNFFDVAHGHDILMHVPDTQAALAELKRVLKPGGVIGCREMISGSCFTYPDYGIMGRAWETFEDTVASDDGHPQLGKDLKTPLLTAGFTDVHITGSLDMYTTPEDIEFVYLVASRLFLSQDFTETAIAYGASTEELSARIRAAYDEWKNHPGAVCAVAYGEAVASKPGP